MALWRIHPKSEKETVISQSPRIILTFTNKSTKSMRIGLISPYTGSNLGDAAIIETARSQLNRLFPKTEILLIVIDCENVRKLHNAETFPLAAVSRPFYFSSAHARMARISGQAKPQAPDSGTRRRRVKFAIKKLAGAIPFLLPSVRSIRGGIGAIFLEAQHLIKARHLIRDLDALLIAGGGQFDDVYGGPWGHPYAMFKWVSLAKNGHIPVFMAGIGVDALNHPLSRWFVRRTVAKVQRVSLRDAGSIGILNQLGVAREMTPSADLAFGCPQSVDDMTKGRTKSAPQFTIGLSPIAFGRHGSWPEEKMKLFTRYWHEFQTLTGSLLDAGRCIKIFATDEADYPLAQMLYDRFRATAGDGRCVQLLPFSNLPGLLDGLRCCDAIVASRLHGILLSHICGVPTIGISHLRKVRAHMEDMGQERFCLDFESFTSFEARRSLDSLIAERDTIRQKINSACIKRCEAVEKEFAAIGEVLALRPGCRPDNLRESRER
jgi:polysaccharide pyruvyl transferase WcaK-like protein